MDNPDTLNLQTYAVKDAVDSLNSDYQNLLRSLPVLSEKVSTMQKDTENKAKQLKSDMKELIDGYDYLNALSSQIPQSYITHSENYKQSLLYPSGQSLTTIPSTLDSDNTALDKQLELMKQELKSISYERMVVDVLTRPTINASKKLQQKQVKSSGYANTINYSGKRIDTTSSSSAPSSSSSQKTSTMKSYTPASTTRRNYNNNAIRSNTKSLTAMSQRKPTEKDILTSNEPHVMLSSDQPDQFIDIPSFQPSYISTKLSTVPPNVPYIRKTPTDAIIAPSLRPGGPSEDLDELKLVTTEMPPYMMDSSRRKSSKGSKVIPLTRYVYQQTKKNEKEIQVVKDLIQGQSDLNEIERLKAMNQYKHLEMALHRQKDDIQSSTSHMLQTAVNQLESAINSDRLRSSRHIVTLNTPVVHAPPPGPAESKGPQTLDDILKQYKVLPVKSSKKSVATNTKVVTTIPKEIPVSTEDSSIDDSSNKENIPSPSEEKPKYWGGAYQIIGDHENVTWSVLPTPGNISKSVYDMVGNTGMPQHDTTTAILTGFEKKTPFIEYKDPTPVTIPDEDPVIFSPRQQGYYSRTYPTVPLPPPEQKPKESTTTATGTNNNNTTSNTTIITDNTDYTELMALMKVVIGKQQENIETNQDMLKVFINHTVHREREAERLREQELDLAHQQFALHTTTSTNAIRVGNHLADALIEIAKAQKTQAEAHLMELHSRNNLEINKATRLGVHDVMQELLMVVDEEEEVEEIVKPTVTFRNEDGILRTTRISGPTDSVSRPHSVRNVQSVSTQRAEKSQLLSGQSYTVSRGSHIRSSSSHLHVSDSHIDQPHTSHKLHSNLLPVTVEDESSIDTSELLYMTDPTNLLHTNYGQIHGISTNSNLSNTKEIRKSDTPTHKAPESTIDSYTYYHATHRENMIESTLSSRQPQLLPQKDTKALDRKPSYTTIDDINMNTITSVKDKDIHVYEKDEVEEENDDDESSLFIPLTSQIIGHEMTKQIYEPHQYQQLLATVNHHTDIDIDIVEDDKKYTNEDKHYELHRQSSDSNHGTADSRSQMYDRSDNYPLSSSSDNNDQYIFPSLHNDESKTLLEDNLWTSNDPPSMSFRDAHVHGDNDVILDDLEDESVIQEDISSSSSSISLSATSVIFEPLTLLRHPS